MLPSTAADWSKSSKWILQRTLKTRCCPHSTSSAGQEDPDNEELSPGGEHKDRLPHTDGGQAHQEHLLGGHYGDKSADSGQVAPAAIEVPV